MALSIPRRQDSRPELTENVQEVVRPRHRLVMRMLEKRDVLRMVVAPRGFGKSTLLDAYASVVFAGDETVRLDGSDPELVCSIDEGTFPRIPPMSEGRLRLLVIDDLPFLDETRRVRFERAIENLLDDGVEVVCAMTPSCNVFDSLRSSAVVITPRELFVTSEEYEQGREAACCPERGQAEVARWSHDTAPPVLLHAADARPLIAGPAFDPLKFWGIPSLVWSDSTFSAGRCLKGFLDEKLPSEFVDAAVAMLLLEDGEFSQVESLGLRLDADIIDLLKVWYPLFGIDEISRTFHALPLEIADLEMFADVMSHGLWHGAGGLFGRLVAQLTGRGSWARAACVTEALGRTEDMLDFVSRHAETLLDEGLYEQVISLLRRAGAESVVFEQRFTVSYALALMLAGAPGKAVAYLEDVRHLRALGTGELVVARALGMAGVGSPKDEAGAARPRQLSLFSDGEADSARLTEQPPCRDFSCLASQACGQASEGCACPPSAPESTRPQAPDTCLLVNLLLALDDHPQPGRVCELAGDLDRLLDDEHAGLFNRPLGRLVLHRLLGAPRVAGLSVDSVTERVESVVRAMRAPMTSLTEALLVVDLEQTGHGPTGETGQVLLSTAHLLLDSLPLLVDATVPASLLARLGLLPLCMRPSEVLLDRRAADKAGITCGTPQEGESSDGDVGEETRRPLYVKMFGGFELFENGEPLSNSHLEKRQARHLIALLALNRGREVSRDHILGEMWPNSDAVHARNCFYVVWGHVRAGLGLDGDEAGPGTGYISFRESTLAINRNLVDTDVERFERLCRSLVASQASQTELVDTFTELERVYRGDLLTCEFASRFFERKRTLYHDMFVDAIVGASSQAADVGNASVALWFARTAFEFSPDREDVYYALARAQMVSGQNSAAIRTFWACRNFLSSELGVEPSERMVELYRRASGL